MSNRDRNLEVVKDFCVEIEKTIKKDNIYRLLNKYIKTEQYYLGIFSMSVIGKDYSYDFKCEDSLKILHRFKHIGTVNVGKIITELGKSHMEQNISNIIKDMEEYFVDGMSIDAYIDGGHLTVDAYFEW